MSEYDSDAMEKERRRVEDPRHPPSPPLRGGEGGEVKDPTQPPLKGRGKKG